MRMVLVGVMVALGWGVVASSAAAQLDLPVLRPGVPVLGEIVDGDPVVETEKLRAGYTSAPTVGRRFRIEVDEPGTYRVELRSCFFDAYLVLRDEGSGVVAEDDDGLVGTHAQVEFEGRVGVPVVVDACALHGKRGNFEIALVRGAVAEVEPRVRQQQAIDEARRCLEEVERKLGPAHLGVATSLNSLAALLQAAGVYGEARPLYERSLAIRETALGSAHPDVALSLEALASLHYSKGEYAEARPLFERALAIWETRLGPDSTDLALSLNNLAELLRAMGEYGEARPLFERSLAILEVALGPDHPAVATSLNNLAMLLHTIGAYGEARPLYERSLAIKESTLGPDHPELALTLNNLAGLLQSLGAYGEARPLFERSLAIWDAALGPNHPNVAASLNNLAGLLRAMGAYDEARPLYERSLAIIETALGTSHPNVAACLNNLAILHYSMGAYGDARPLFERSLAIMEAELGPEHPAVASSLSNLANLLHSMGAYSEARPLLERSLAIREAALGTDHPDVALSLNNLAELLGSMGAHGEARPLFERSLAIRKAALGPDHPDLAESLNNLAGLLRAVGAYNEALPLYERSLAIYEAVRGPVHPDVATSLNNLAQLLRILGELSEARPLHERSLAIREAVLGPDHPDVALSLNCLAMLDLDLGNAAAAAALVARAVASRANHLLDVFAGASESDARQYAGKLTWQVEFAQNPALRQGRAEPTYSILLTWKGQLLRVARASRNALRERITPEVLAVAQRLREIATALSRETRDIGLAVPRLTAAQLDGLIAERERLERELAPHLAGLLPPVPAWPELRAALPPKAALVDLFIHPVYEPARLDGDRVIAKGRWTEPVVSAWITRAESREPLHVDLGPVAAIEAAAHGALGLVGEPRGAPVTTRQQPDADLSRLVWEPLRPHLEGCDTLIISPDGVLATVPFEMLREDGASYLVESRRIVYLTDPTDLVRLPEAVDRPAPTLLAVGDIDYDSVDAENEAPSGGATPLLAMSEAAGLEPASLRGAMTAEWKRLTGTAQEVTGVAQLHAERYGQADRRILTGPNATAEQLKSLLPAYSTVHIATHGYFNPEGLPSLEAAARRAAEAQLTDPLRFEESFTAAAKRLEGYSPGVLSGLVCAGANANLQPPRDDGYLTAEEVGWLDLSGVDLVILSACDTGLGRPQSGEGLLGLRRAFLTAGAKTVISSLWSVPDQETAELMALFYRNLWQRGLGKHESLREAQLELIRRNRQCFDGDARPATWGAFVVDGDWR